MKDKNQWRRGMRFDNHALRRMEEADYRDITGGAGIHVSNFGDRMVISAAERNLPMPGLQVREFVVKEIKNTYLVCNPYCIGVDKIVEDVEINVAKPGLLRTGTGAANPEYVVYDAEETDPPDVILAAVRPTGLEDEDDRPITWIDLNIGGRGPFGMLIIEFTIDAVGPPIVGTIDLRPDGMDAVPDEDEDAGTVELVNPHGYEIEVGMTGDAKYMAGTWRISNITCPA